MATAFASSRCAKCKEVVGYGPECFSCSGKFHFGCSGITERVFERLEQNKKNWSCSSCRENKPKLAPISKQLSQGKDPIQNIDVDCGLVMGKAVKLILAKISSLETQFAAFQSLQTNIKQVVNDIAELKTILDSRIDEVTNKVSDIDSRVSLLEVAKKDVTDLKATVTELLERDDLISK
ncbi:unnamed protein product [Chilo suppressalis]|uniref:Zinc finger PHD-type domain-containing protein n=1 Tax=Chilo suppressalis TaxID=168631 RepID=A0ABN8B1X7_CHISP|nr:unnamed protein product [Chilo suppressalis]